MLGEKRKLTILIMIILVFILSILGLNIFYLKDFELNERAAFGDMFGGVNALFSGLALAGIVISIRLQSKELRLQREELKDTRLELKRSAEAQEKSEEALTKQFSNMQVTGRLNALNTLINYNRDYMDIIMHENRPAFDRISLENSEYKEEIKSILKLLKQSD